LQQKDLKIIPIIWLFNYTTPSWSAPQCWWTYFDCWTASEIQNTPWHFLAISTTLLFIVRGISRTRIK